MEFPPLPVFCFKSLVGLVLRSECFYYVFKAAVWRWPFPLFSEFVKNSYSNRSSGFESTVYLYVCWKKERKVKNGGECSFSSYFLCCLAFCAVNRIKRVTLVIGLTFFLSTFALRLRLCVCLRLITLAGVEVVEVSIITAVVEVVRKRQTNKKLWTALTLF